MVERIGFLFSGQGAQYPGMGRDLWERYSRIKELFHLASDLSGKNMERLLFEGSDEVLRDTQNTQIAVTLVNLSVLRVLKEEGIDSFCAAGFSLGEFSAMVDCAILLEEDVFRLVIERGRIMTEASNQAIQDYGEVAMGAVIGLDFKTAQRVIMESGVSHIHAANDNSPTQVVISGTVRGMADVQDALKAAGAKKVIPLKVSGPFHTPLLQPGESSLASCLDGLDFHPPVKPFYSNVTGEEVRGASEAKALALKQMTSAVQWVSIEREIGRSPVDRVAELGPGSVLTGLWKKSKQPQEIYTCGTLEGIEKLLQIRKN